MTVLPASRIDNDALERDLTRERITSPHPLEGSEYLAADSTLIDHESGEEESR